MNVNVSHLLKSTGAESVMSSGRSVDRLKTKRGSPKMIVSDNGTELTSNAILSWSDQPHIGRHDMARNEPTQITFVESFKGSSNTMSYDETLCSFPRVGAFTFGRFDSATTKRCDAVRGSAGWARPFTSQHGQGAALANGYAPWPAVPIVQGSPPDSQAEFNRN